MYSLLSRIQNGPQPLRTRFEEHVERVGLAAVERVMPAPGAVTETGKAEVLVSGHGTTCWGNSLMRGQEPKAYIEALLDVHGKYKEVVDVCFKAELGFNASLDRVCSPCTDQDLLTELQACRKFFNKNAAATTSTKSPELLASYCDQLLKKSNKDLDAEALEKQLTQAMIIFDYIDDKDVFQKFYQKKLAQRLVMGLSASDDSESSMISKLKEKCGFDYTNKLQKMFTDVGIGRDLTDRFKEKERQAGRDDDGELRVHTRSAARLMTSSGGHLHGSWYQLLAARTTADRLCGPARASADFRQLHEVLRRGALVKPLFRMASRNR